MKRFFMFILCLSLLSFPVYALEPVDTDLAPDIPCAALMEKSTGEIIYEKNAFEHRSPASVTKVMTMLLVVEAIDRGDIALTDTVTASQRAASMGGSQIWLEEGERMTVDEMLKCVTVVSANDCCVALAEHLCGTEEAFVAAMNARAKELGMNDTHFTCCSGLMESEDHYSCAHDIALMSRELLQHDIIKNYTTIWMDNVRGGEFTLSNTNKLIYHYDGATGLKTGFTSKAMFCLSASAERDGIEYIAVVLAAPTSSERFEAAKAMLSYAFANYTVCHPLDSISLQEVPVRLGSCESFTPVPAEEMGFLISRSKVSGLEYSIDLPDSVSAPIAQGQVIGTVTAVSGGETIAEIDLLSPEEVTSMTISGIFLRLMRTLLGCDESQTASKEGETFSLSAKPMTNVNVPVVFSCIGV